MRSSVLFCIIFLLFEIGVIFAQDKKPNFAGEWNLDRDKSELGGGGGGRGGGMMAAKMVVTQEANKLVVESTRTNRDGEEMTVSATYTLDGKECENNANNRTSKSTAVWSKDGKSLEINTATTFSRNGQSFTMNEKSIWSLDSGNLMINATRSSQRGDRTSKLVYTKAAKKM
jgi:hypothetical protein